MVDKGFIVNGLPPVLVSQLRKINNLFKVRNACKQFEKMQVIVNDESVINEFFSEKKIREHFPNKNIINTVLRPTIFRTQIRYFRYYDYFKKIYPEMFDSSVKVVDIGDASGMLLASMGRNGESANIDPKVVKRIQRNGLEAQVADICNLPFEDKSIDYVLAFQILEHVDSPLKALKEIGRVVRKKVFISIPYRIETRIYDKEYWLQMARKSFNEGGWELSNFDEYTDCHIFEFSTADFLKLLSYTNLRCKKSFPLNFFFPLGVSASKWGVMFNFFDLEPDNVVEVSGGDVQ
jgi:SAM-dependent methyltransferase